MAKTRMINTSFWRDNFITNLDPAERYLYLYLLTNPDTNISGVYQIPIKIMATDTGYDAEMLLKMLVKFEQYGKIKYENGWVAIKNFIKNQNQKSLQVIKGIENELKNAPESLILWLNSDLEGIDTLSHLNLNLNSNLNINNDTVEDKEPLEITKLVNYMQHAFLDKQKITLRLQTYQIKQLTELLESYGFEDLQKRIDNFLNYDYYENIKDNYSYKTFYFNVDKYESIPKKKNKENSKLGNYQKL